MKKELSTTKFSITLMFFYLLSISTLLTYILNQLNNINLNPIIGIAIIILSLLISTTIIPNLIIKKLLKNKIISNNDIKIIKKNIIIAFLILLIGFLIYRIPNYIKDLNEVSKELNEYLKITTDIYQDYPSFHLLEDKLAFLKIDIIFEIIRTLFVFGSNIYFLTNDIKNYTNIITNNKIFYIKKILMIIGAFLIYLCLNIIPGLFHHVH